MKNRELKKEKTQNQDGEVLMMFWIIDEDTNLYESSCSVSKEYYQECVEYNKNKSYQDPIHKDSLHSIIHQVLFSSETDNNTLFPSQKEVEPFVVIVGDAGDSSTFTFVSKDVFEHPACVISTE